MEDRETRMFYQENGYTESNTVQMVKWTSTKLDMWRKNTRMQVEGLDFFETYAPTCKLETFRTLLAVAAQKDLHLGQMDVKSAYLHSAIEEEIYLEQPPGFVKRGQNGETQVCKLNKSIYGLKQAAKSWYEALANLLISSGFHRSRNDYCLFVRKDTRDTFSYVLVWVDHIIVAEASNEIMDAIKSLRKKNFKMSDRENYSGSWECESSDRKTFFM